MVAQLMQQLECRRCGRSWERKPKRGRRPVICPDCVEGKQLNKPTPGKSVMCAANLHITCAKMRKQHSVYADCTCDCHVSKKYSKYQERG